MAKITKITTQKKRGRFNIYVDRGNGEEFGFGISEDILVSFALSKGMEIDEEQLRQIVFQDEVQKAFNLAVSFLSYRMRSRKEILDYLTKKEVVPEVQERVVSDLEEKRYINDLAFAKAFVRSKKNTSVKGPGAISRELVQKGVRAAKIEEALLQYPFEEQVERAASFAKKKAGQQHNKSTAETKQSVAQTLVGKGFSWNTIEAAFEETAIDKNEDEEWEALVKQGEKAHRKYSKYDGWEYKRRMKQHLYRKGFPLPLIDHFIEETENKT